MGDRTVEVECLNAECCEYFEIEGDTDGLTLNGTCPSCGASGDHLIVDDLEDDDLEDDDEDDEDLEDEEGDIDEDGAEYDEYEDDEDL